MRLFAEDHAGLAPATGMPARLRRLGFVAAFTGFALLLRLRQGFGLFLRDPRLAAVVLVSMGISAFLAAMLLPNGDEAEAAAPPALVEAAPLPAPVTPPSPIALSPPPEAWQGVRKPVAMFHLESPDFERHAFRLEVETRGRHDRRDILSWAPREAAGAGASVLFAVERYEARSPTARPFYADLAQRAAMGGFSVERMSAPGEIATKFGGFEIADAILAGEAGRSACLLFRRVDMAGITFAGWYCGNGRKPADRVSAGCFIDRLDLLGAGKDVELKRLFAAAERNRAACGRGPGARKLTWLDHEAPVPPLKLQARR